MTLQFVQIYRIPDNRWGWSVDTDSPTCGQCGDADTYAEAMAAVARVVEGVVVDG